MKHTNFHKTSPKETREKWELVFFVCMFVTSYNFETATHASMAFWRHWRGRSIVLSFKLLSWTLRHVFGDENLEQGILTLWIGCLASCIWVLTVAKILYFFLLCFQAAVFCYFLFSKRHFVLRANSSDDFTCRGVISWLISFFRS